MKIHKEITNVICFAKPATYAHQVKEQFSPSMDSSIDKLTNCQYTTAKCLQVCFC